jgi:hypothetical protein
LDFDDDNLAGVRDRLDVNAITASALTLNVNFLGSDG